MRKILGGLLRAAFITAFAVPLALTVFIGDFSGMRSGPEPGDLTLIGSYLRFVAPAEAQNSGVLLDRPIVRGHMSATTVSPPVISSCGSSPTVTGGSTDFIGQVTVKGAACTITFGTAFTNAPLCVVSDQSASSNNVGWTVSATALTISSGVTSNDKVNWICVGN